MSDVAASWEARGPRVLAVRCTSCNTMIGAVHPSPMGLLLGMDPQRPRRERDLPVKLGDVVLAPTEDWYVFVLSERLSFTRDFCRCGRRPLDLSWERIATALKASHSSLSV